MRAISRRPSSLPFSAMPMCSISPSLATSPPALSHRSMPPLLASRPSEKEILPDARPEGRSATDRRVQALPPEHLARDHTQYQGRRHRGYGDLPARHADDHGSERALLV